MGTTAAAKVSNRGNTWVRRAPVRHLGEAGTKGHQAARVRRGQGRRLAGRRLHEGLHERARLRRIPPARADHAPDQLALAIDEVERGRSPHAIETPGDVPGSVDQNRGLVAALVDRFADDLRVFPKVDEPDFETTPVELLVQRADGR